nr:PREDICTED: kinesin-like protein KIF22 [Latimeria chalumnae]|eukprot:XP_014353463.1 PREDICTED: kinesin-like protein KIF22 [Latimeria chalumnae]
MESLPQVRRSSPARVMRVSSTESLHQLKKLPSTRVRVAVRLRPYMSQDDEKQQGACVRGIDSQSLEIVNWRNQLETMYYQIFPPPPLSLSLRELRVSRCGRQVLWHQELPPAPSESGSRGKTHTMLGDSEQPGVIPRAVRDIFQMSREQRTESGSDQWRFSIVMSYLEIYQEKVLDLLEPKNHDLPIREDKDKNIFIPKLMEQAITSFADFEKHFIPASQNRTVASTKLNNRSSRSHSVLLLKVVKTQSVSPVRQLTGKLYLIDLAGSEDNRKTGNQGIRLKESGAINSSLFVLSKVVDALNQGLPRIPYRDSKLTRLLQDSLGGTSHSVMITNIAPEYKYYFDTVTALNFAAKSKQIINKPFTREIIQTVAAQMKRPREDEQNHPNAQQHPKKLRKSNSIEEEEEGEELLSPSTSALSPMLKSENMNPHVIARLLKLEKVLRKTMKGVPLLGTPKRERLALLKKVEESQLEIQKLKEKQKELERKAAQALPEMPQSSGAEAGEGVFKTSRAPLQNKSSSAKLRKQAIVTPLQVQNREVPVTKKGVLIMKRKEGKRKAESVSDEEKEVSWEIKLDAELLQKHRASILQVLNSGSLKDLKCLQRIGDKKAKLIIGWREVNGPFSQVEDLEKIGGFSAKQMASFLKANILSSIGS